MKYFLTSCILLALIFTACDDQDEQELPSFDNPFLIETGSRPLTIAHRGGTKFYPENTMLAFEYSQQIGADVLELDVHMSSDSQLVICHDHSVDRTSDQTGAIYQYTYEELTTFNFGYHFKDENGEYPFRDDPVNIPLMEEVFQEFSDMKMVIEIKSQGLVGKQTAAILLELIEAYGMQEKVAVFSFDNNIMNYYHAHNDVNSYTGASLNDAIDFIAQVSNSNGVNARYQMLALPIELEGVSLGTDNPNVLKSAHDNGLSICYWTINNEQEMRNLVTKGADGIITDRPELLLEVLEEMGF